MQSVLISDLAEVHRYAMLQSRHWAITRGKNEDKEHVVQPAKGYISVVYLYQ